MDPSGDAVATPVGRLVNLFTYLARGLDFDLGPAVGAAFHFPVDPMPGSREPGQVGALAFAEVSCPPFVGRHNAARGS